MENKISRLTLYSTLAAMWCGHFLVDMMIGFWAVYKCIAQLDIALCGLIAGISALIGEGMQLAFGMLGDKGYRKQVLIFGLLAAASSALIGYTHNYLFLFGLILLTCIGSGAFHPSAAAIVNGLTEKKKGMFIAIFACGGSFGIATSQLIFSTSYTYLKDHMIFLALPAVLLVTIIVLFAFPAFKSTQPRNQSHGFKGIKEFFKRRELTALYISQVCNQSVIWGMIFLLPDVLYARGYSDWISFGGGHLVYILGSAIMLVPAGMLADKFSAKKVMITAMVVGLGLFYYFLMGPVLPVMFLLPILFVTGALQGLLNPVALSLGYKLMPESPGLISGIMMGLVWCIAEAIGPGGGGLLAHYFSDDSAAKALSVLGLLFFVAIFFAMRLPNVVTRKERLEIIEG